MCTKLASKLLLALALASFGCGCGKTPISPAPCGAGGTCGECQSCMEGHCYDDAVCDGGAEDVGTPEPPPDVRGETCNGVDDDQDGETDEDFDVGNPCDGTGECGAGTRECADESSTRCSTDPGGSMDGSGSELCDGLDNDCNAATPDGNDETWFGTSCDGSDVGLCEEGTFGCDGVGQICSDNTTDDPDLCNGSDDDCDPATADGSAEPWYGLLCDGPDVGLCEEGFFGCDGVGQICSDATTDDPDLCNGVDDDCDPTTPDGSAEVWFGQPCDGAGECGMGVVECATTSTIRCSTEVVENQPEDCDALDNDCDGLTDEEYGDGTVPCDGMGACGLGVLECTGIGAPTCSTDPGGSAPHEDVPETCDGTDQDCDGLTDEEFGDGTVPCDGIGECGAGVIECTGSSGTRCSTEPGGSQQQGQPESCDGLDNDCDGQVDETAGVRALTAVDTVGDVGQYTSVAIGSNGLPVIAYHDVTNGDLKIAVCTSADCSTNTLVTADDDGGGPNVVGFYASLAVDSNGLPTVSHEDRTFRDLKVTKCSDPTCSSVATEVVAGDGAGPALFGLCAVAIPGDDLPVIAHLDNVVEVLRVAKCGDAACSSGNNFYDIDTLEAPARGVSIAIGADLLPVMSHVRALGAPQELVVSRCLLADCSTGATNQIVDSDTRSFSTSIVIGDDGLPVVAYEGDSALGLRVAKCGNADCSSGNVLTTLDAGRDVRYVSIAIGTDGLPVIAYEDNGDLRVAKCADASCSTPCGAGTVCTVVDSCGDVGQWNSIAVPPDGLPIISYYDATNGDLKFLKCATPSCGAWDSLPGGPEARLGHSSVWTGTEMVIWGGELVHDGAVTNTGYRYSPATRQWTSMSTSGAPSARYTPGAPGAGVWVASRFCVWGGGRYTGVDYENYGDGACYNPAADTWTPMTTSGAPSPRRAHSILGVDDKLIVWGGICTGLGCTATGIFDDGAIYDPVADSWTPVLSNGSPPAPRYSHTAVWTGSEMIVWGGENGYLDTGARYDVASESWTALPLGPCGRGAHRAVWTGTEMLVWGGFGGIPSCPNGGFPQTVERYSPTADSWTSCCDTDAPEARQNLAAVWTGSRMIVWGGNKDPMHLNTGGVFDPMANTWIPTPTAAAPSPRASHSAVWTGSEMLVWGGWDNTVPIVFGDGGSFRP